MPSEAIINRFRIGAWPRVTALLSIVVVFVFLLQLALAPDGCWSTRYPAFCVELVLLREVTWLGVLLMPFLHGSWLHLGGNLLMLTIFGGGTEHLYGRRQLLWLFFAGGYLSTELQLLQKLAADQPPVTVGISGAVYGLGAFLGVMLLPASRRALAESRKLDSGGAAMIRPPLLVMGLFTFAHALLSHAGFVSIDPRAATLTHLTGVVFGAGTAVYLRIFGTRRFELSIPTNPFN